MTCRRTDAYATTGTPVEPVARAGTDTGDVEPVHRNLPTRWFLAATVVAALGLSACGGEEAAPPPPPPPSPSPTPPPAPEVAVAAPAVTLADPTVVLGGSRAAPDDAAATAASDAATAQAVEILEGGNALLHPALDVEGFRSVMDPFVNGTDPMTRIDVSTSTTSYNSGHMSTVVAEIVFASGATGQVQFVYTAADPASTALVAIEGGVR